MTELLPCPWCGKQPTLHENRLGVEILYEYGCFSAEHHTCSVGFYPMAEIAAEHWNKRYNGEVAQDG